MNPQFKSKIINSLIQLILGVLLLALASWYLVGHPAEWQSIKSSVSTAKQKITKLVGMTEKINGGALVSAQKAQALNSFKEIISTIQSCDPTASVEEAQTLYGEISNSSLDEFARNSSKYYNEMNTTYKRMQQLCNVVPKTLDE